PTISPDSSIYSIGAYAASVPTTYFAFSPPSPLCSVSAPSLELSDVSPSSDEPPHATRTNAANVKSKKAKNDFDNAFKFIEIPLNIDRSFYFHVNLYCR